MASKKSGRTDLGYGHITDWGAEYAPLKSDPDIYPMNPSRSKIKAFGLPGRIDSSPIPVNEFKGKVGEREFISFLDEHPGHELVVRAIPNNPDLPNRNANKLRTGPDNSETYQNALRFLDGFLPKGKEKEYAVTLSANEPTKYVGGVLSTGSELLVELIGADQLPGSNPGADGLALLSHGKGPQPVQAKFSLDEKTPYGRWEYSTKDPEQIETIQKAVRHLKVDGSERNFTPGYFDFLAAEGGHITFTDYKGGKAFVKLP